MSPTENETEDTKSADNSHSLMFRLMPKPTPSTNIEKRGLFKTDSETALLIIRIQQEIKDFDITKVNSTNASLAKTRIEEQIKQLITLAGITKSPSPQHQNLVALKIYVEEKLNAICVKFPDKHQHTGLNPAFTQPL